MQSLIEHSILREMKIIQALFLSDKPLKDKDILELNKCSLATAKTDKASIARKYADVFGAISEEGTIYFTKKSLAVVIQTIRSLFAQSLRIQLIFEIFDQPFESRQYYCKAVSISEASFYRTIGSVNKVLNQYDFHIQFLDGGYYLKTDSERALRRFIVSLFLETKTEDESFIRIPYETLKIYFLELTEEHLYSIEQSFLTQIHPWDDEDKKKKLSMPLKTLSKKLRFTQEKL